MVLLLPALLFLLAYTILLFYYRAAWSRMKEYQAGTRTNKDLFITVLIPARNEADNLPALFESLRAQEYPRDKFEVIVIDDFSTDRTAAIVAGEGGNVHLIRLLDHLALPVNSYKKKAIEIGIEKSRGELIVTTDADCTMGPGWLQTIADFYADHQPAMIVMPVYMHSNGSFLENFQSLDFMSLQGITAASTHDNFHGMCNGANLAYQKKAFTKVNGFEHIDSIASGDDMLLMHKFAKDHLPIRYLFSGKVIVTTKPMGTWKKFFHQRIRWASKASSYQDKRLLPVLLLVYLLNLALLALPVVAIFYNPCYQVWGACFSLLLLSLLAIVFKTIVEMVFLYPVANFFKASKMMRWFPLAQPFHILYTVLVGFLGKWGKYQWKGRKVK